MKGCSQLTPCSDVKQYNASFIYTALKDVQPLRKVTSERSYKYMYTKQIDNSKTVMNASI